MKKELAKLQEVKAEQDKRLECCLAYKDFMNSVVAESNGEFEDIPQVITRYHELLDIRNAQVHKTVQQVENALMLKKELLDIQQV